MLLYIQEGWSKRMKKNEIVQTSADSDECVNPQKANWRFELDKK